MISSNSISREKRFVKAVLIALFMAVAIGVNVLAIVQLVTEGEMSAPLGGFIWGALFILLWDMVRSWNVS